MHNELNRSKKPKTKKKINCEGETLENQSEIWAKSFLLRDNSIMTDLFGG